ncbi:30S ribosome-binding factor RbfA [Pirellulaceae bacterium SH467]|jgi:ribosome-binding factor A
MTARRLLKAGEAIREVVSMAILTELRDPRVKNVTVLGVEVAPDMREAKVIVSVMGNKTQQSTSLRGLQNSAGFLQAKIADRIDTRYTPRLTFVLDDGIKKSLAVSQILDQIAAERAADQRAKTGDEEVVAEEELLTDSEEGLDTREASGSAEKREAAQDE